MLYDAATSGLLSQIDYYVRSAAGRVAPAKTAQRNDRSVQDVWFDPAEDSIILRRQTPAESVAAKIKTAGINTAIPTHWCGLALADGIEYFQSARALADAMMGVAPKTAAANNPTTAQKAYSMLGWDDRYYPTNPLAAMLATGILGAGVGYGGASLIAPFLPNVGKEEWNRKRFRRSGALLGVLAGALPGAVGAGKSLLIGQSPLDGSHMKSEKPALRRLADTLGLKRYSNAPDNAVFSYIAPLADQRLKKWGDYSPLPLQRYSGMPQISGDELMRMTWKHPAVSNQMTPGQQALLSGAVHGAVQMAGSSFFTPRDMARLTAGMGSGYGLGLVAGRVLGTLTGLPKPAQDTLANTGMYAGALKAVLPIIYGM